MLVNILTAMALGRVPLTGIINPATFIPIVRVRIRMINNSIVLRSSASGLRSKTIVSVVMCKGWGLGFRV